MRRRTWILALVAAFTYAAGSATQAAGASSGSKVRPAKTAAKATAPKSGAAPKAVAARKTVVRTASAKTGARKAGPAQRGASGIASKRAEARVVRTAAARGPAAKARAVRVTAAPREVVPARVSIGQAIGLHATDDPLDLRSSVALVVDQQTGETLFSKNARAVLPIASITKLMTAMVVIDSHAPLNETLAITTEDIDTEKGSGSRLLPGTRLSRGEMLQLALMSSENRAAHALGRHHPGGLAAFVEAMNAKARTLGMHDTRFVEPTGLSSSNVSTAHDLARLVREAFEYPLVRQYSTASDLTVDTGYRQIGYRNTNRLISSPTWDIGLQKTGYISEAGSCLVMQVSIEGRPLVMVLLDATGSSSRFGDANRLRRWIEHEGGRAAPVRTVSASPSIGS